MGTTCTETEQRNSHLLDTETNIQRHVYSAKTSREKWRDRVGDSEQKRKTMIRLYYGRRALKDKESKTEFGKTKKERQKNRDLRLGWSASYLGSGLETFW